MYDASERVNCDGGLGEKLKEIVQTSELIQYRGHIV